MGHGPAPMACAALAVHGLAGAAARRLSSPRQPPVACVSAATNGVLGAASGVFRSKSAPAEQITFPEPQARALSNRAIKKGCLRIRAVESPPTRAVETRRLWIGL